MIKEFSTYNESSTEFKVGDIVYYYGLEKKLHGQKVKIIGYGKDMYVEFLNKSPNRFVEVSGLSKSEKEIKRKYTPEDPFGEEDWDANESTIFKNLIDISNLFNNYKHDSLILDFLEKRLKHKTILVKKKSGDTHKLVNVRDVKCFSNGKETEFDLVCLMGVGLVRLKTITVKKGDIIEILGDKHIIKNPDVDPFGEEDWDSIGESLNESEFKIGDIVYYYGLEKKLHGQKAKIVANGNNRFTSSKEYYVEFFNKSPRRVVKVSKLSKSEKEIKRKYTPEDPFGEEDWDANESLNEYKKFGTKGLSIIISLHKILFGVEKLFNLIGTKNDVMKGEYNRYKSLKLFYDFLNRENIKEKIEFAKNSRENINEIVDYIKGEYEKYRRGHDFFNDLNVYIDYFQISYSLISDKGEVKLKDIKNSLPIGLKITPEDPFGEEDWDVNESLNVYHYKIGDDAYYYGNETTLHGKKVKIKEIGSDRAIVYFPDGCSSNRRVDYFKLLPNEKKIERRYSQDDPYGEEDWVNESFNEYKYNVGDIVYYYGNAIKLHGERVKIIRHVYGDYEVKFLDLQTGERCVGESKLRSSIKIEKRKYTQDDPYGEEDWENENWNPFKRKSLQSVSMNSDIDPYGEEDWDNSYEHIRKELMYQQVWGNVFRWKIFLNVQDKCVHIGNMSPSYEFEPNIFFKNKLLKKIPIDNLKKYRGLHNVDDDFFEKILEYLQKNTNMLNYIKYLIKK